MSPGLAFAMATRSVSEAAGKLCVYRHERAYRDTYEERAKLTVAPSAGNWLEPRWVRVGVWVLLIGVLALVLTSRMRYPAWQRLATPLLGVTLMLLVLVLLAGIVHVAVDERRVVVLVAVVVRPVVELAKRPAGVVMGHVVVVVRVDDTGMRMLVLRVAHHALHDRALLHLSNLLVTLPPRLASRESATDCRTALALSVMSR